MPNIKSAKKRVKTTETRTLRTKMYRSEMKTIIKKFDMAVESGDKENQREELGDVLFSAVNVARFLDIDSEHALYDACDKFTDRFSKVESLANERGIDMKTASLSVLDSLWDEVKILYKDN